MQNKIKKILSSLSIALLVVAFMAIFVMTTKAGSSDRITVNALVFSKSGQLIDDGIYDIRMALYTVNRMKKDSYPSNKDEKERIWSVERRAEIEDGKLKVTLEVPSVDYNRYYLGIRINKDDEMIPRKAIVLGEAVLKEVEVKKVEIEETKKKQSDVRIEEGFANQEELNKTLIEAVQNLQAGTSPGNIPILNKDGKINRSLLDIPTPAGTGGLKNVTLNINTETIAAQVTTSLLNNNEFITNLTKTAIVNEISEEIINNLVNNETFTTNLVGTIITNEIVETITNNLLDNVELITNITNTVIQGDALTSISTNLLNNTEFVTDITNKTIDEITNSMSKHITNNSAVDGNTIIYDSTTDSYVSAVLELELLKDMNLSSIEEQDFLVYDDDNNEWVNKTLEGDNGIEIDGLKISLNSGITNLSDVYSSMSPSDGQVLTYDTTNGWQSETISSGGSSTFIGLADTPSGYTAGSLLFTSGSAVAQDNANLFWDDTNNRLGIGIATPAHPLDVVGTGRFTGALTVGAYTLPNTDGTASQVLKTDGSGALTWQTDTNTGSTTFLGLTDTPSAYTTGSLLFTSGSEVTQDNANLFWDDTTNRLGIGTTTPTQSLEIAGGNIQIDNTTNTNQDGIIYKGATPFIHDFNYGDNGSVATDGYNIFIGLGAGNLTMGSTATEKYHGSYNTIVGNSTLINNTTGYENTAFGNGSLRVNTTGYDNTANGAYSLYLNTTGSLNTTSGYRALFANTTGFSNTAMGYEAGRYASDGATANSTGAENIFLGAETKALNNGDSNEIVIGYKAVGIGSNTVMLGGDNIITTALKGNVGINTTSPGYRLDVAGTGGFTGALTVGGYTLPNIDGTANQVLKTNGSGALTWQTDTNTGSTTFLGLGDTPNTYTAGSLLFTSGSEVTQDNANLFWDDTTNRMGIGTNTPNSMLSLYGVDNSMRLSYDASNHADLTVNNQGEFVIDAPSGTESAMVIGSGGAQDTSIQFDGEMHDFFAGIDNSTGTYSIGVGTDVTTLSTVTGVGTVSNSAGGTTVTGVGTNFSRTFRVGNTITINTETVTISAIASDTSLTTTAITNANSGVVYTYNGGTKVVVDASGNLGVGIENPLYALDVTTTGTSAIVARFNNASTNTSCTLSTNGGTINCSSDRNLKKNFEPIVNGLETLVKLNPTMYNWKTESDDTPKMLGFIAQEVQEVIPQMVITDESTGYLQLSTVGMIPVITQAIKEQNVNVIANTLKTAANITNLVELQTSVDSNLLLINQGLITLKTGVNTNTTNIAMNTDDILVNKTELDALSENVTLLTELINGTETVDGLIDTITQHEERIAGIETILIAGGVNLTTVTETGGIIGFTISDALQSFSDNLQVVTEEQTGERSVQIFTLSGDLIIERLKVSKVVIKGSNEKSSTIGNVVICPEAYYYDRVDQTEEYSCQFATDSNDDGIDDTTKLVISNGLSIMVQNEVVTADSTIFTTFENNPGAVSWVEKVKDREVFTGFKIHFEDKINEGILVRWWMIESEK